MVTYTLAGRYQPDQLKHRYIIFSRHGKYAHIEPVDKNGRRMTGGFMAFIGDLSTYVESEDRMPKSWREVYETEAQRLIRELPADSVADFYTGDDEAAIRYYKSPEGSAAFREVLCSKWVADLSDDSLQGFVDGFHQKWDHYEETWFTDDTWFTIQMGEISNGNSVLRA